jgi:hypothetical protein
VFEGGRFKPEGRGLETKSGNCMLSVYLMLPAERGPGVYSAGNRNEYQKRKLIKKIQGVERGRCVRLATRRHLRADCLDNARSLTFHSPIDLHSLVRR